MHKKVMIVLFVIVMSMSGARVQAAGTSMNETSPAQGVCYNLNGHPLDHSLEERFRSLLGDAECGSYWFEGGTLWKWDQNANVWRVIVSDPSQQSQPNSNEAELIIRQISGRQVEIAKQNRGVGYLYTISLCASGRYQKVAYTSRSSGWSEWTEQGTWQVRSDQGVNYLQLTSSGTMASFPVRINAYNRVESGGDFDFVLNGAVHC